MSIRIYVFNLKKRRKTNTHTPPHSHTNKHTHTHTHTHTQTQEEKRTSVENLKGYNKVICEFALRTLLDVCELALFLLYMNFNCATKEIAIFAILQRHMKDTFSRTKTKTNH